MNFSADLKRVVGRRSYLAPSGAFFHYRHLVYLLLRRRSRKRRFLISNFKHSTVVFEFALPD